MSKRLLVQLTDSERSAKRPRALGPTPEEVQAAWKVRNWCYMSDDRLYDVRVQIWEGLTFSEKTRLSMTCKTLHQEVQLFTQDERALLQWVPWTKPRKVNNLLQRLVEPVVQSLKGITIRPFVTWHGRDEFVDIRVPGHIDYRFTIRIGFRPGSRIALHVKFYRPHMLTSQFGGESALAVAAIRNFLSRRGLLDV